MNANRSHAQIGQMSESALTVAFLTLSGGLQDAYSYCIRGKVFANAQTGNIVLMSQRLFEGDWLGGLQYLIPLASFACGVFVAEQIRARCQQYSRLHWRQIVLLLEIVLLLISGFLSNQIDFLANALVSFSCAMQVQAFRKINGHSLASTMCIGNLRSGVEAFSAYIRTKNNALLESVFHYFAVILLFAFGAGIGSVLTSLWGIRTIWVSCVLLFVSFAVMFIKEEKVIVPK